MYLCIDIGGTKTLIALFTADGRLLHRIRFATLFDQNAFFKQLLTQLHANFSFSDVKCLSVALPGPVKDDRFLWLGNLPWRDFDLTAKLHQAFKLPVFAENDANLAGLAEAKNCHGRSLYLTFSTGIGGAVVENGRLVPRFRDFEPGHTPYVYHGKEYEWEDLASAAAIYDHYHCFIEDIKDPQIWQDITDRLLLGLAPLISALKPDRIFFGGPLGLNLNLYRKLLRKKLLLALPANTKLPRLICAKYGDLSVAYGCYHYAKLRI